MVIVFLSFWEGRARFWFFFSSEVRGLEYLGVCYLVFLVFLFIYLLFVILFFVFYVLGTVFVIVVFFCDIFMVNLSVLEEGWMCLRVFIGFLIFICMVRKSGVGLKVKSVRV